MSATNWRFREVYGMDTAFTRRNDLQVISTPGHTPDSISLLDAGNGLLFTGEHVLPRSNLSLSSGDRPRRLCSIGAKAGGHGPAPAMLLPAHNVPTAESRREQVGER